MRPKRRMTTAEFEAVRPLLKISADRIDAARLALVDGQTLQAVGDHYKWSRQAVGDAVNIVWKTLETYHQAQQAGATAGANLPPGWQQVTLAAPKSMISRFRAEIAEVVASEGKPLANSKSQTRTRKGNQ